MMAATIAIAGPDTLDVFAKMPPLRNAPKITLGLREQIAQAETVAEVERLLSEGRSYDHASFRTRRAWETTARKRIKTINKEGQSK